MEVIVHFSSMISEIQQVEISSKEAFIIGTNPQYLRSIFELTFTLIFTHWRIICWKTKTPLLLSVLPGNIEVQRQRFIFPDLTSVQHGPHLGLHLLCSQNEEGKHCHWVTFNSNSISEFRSVIDRQI